MYSISHPKIQWEEEDRKEIEENAYFKWIDAGRPNDQGNHFWDQAEQEKIKEKFYPHLEDNEELIEFDYPQRATKGMCWCWHVHGGLYYAPCVPLLSF